ncbi:MAG: acyl-CoA thioesterase [Cyclobacteriaceae bacterium]|nr:acyl-CoA thioesterase [Cyclobacteriaceae bacterium]MDH5249610.1 acyl-CoA thioesterase [Cyclobacteriaceae bacterium]
MTAKPVRASHTTITELMIPSYANFGGKIHGGILLSLMDKVAFACATKHSGNYCVTVSVVGVEFLQPVEVGDLVSLLASVNYVGKTSMVIGIKVIAENVKLGLVKHTNTSYFTMVAKDDNDKPTIVPPLLLEDEEEVKRFIESLRMREIESLIKGKLDDVKSSIEVKQASEILKDQRCVIGY